MCGMENRRKNYRHSFPPAEGRHVDLELPARRGTTTGEILDLSIGGMRIRLDKGVDPPKPNDMLRVRSAIPGMDARHGLASAVVYSRTTQDGHYCGIQFLSSTNPIADESREKALWRFLMDEQRQDKVTG